MRAFTLLVKAEESIPRVPRRLPVDRESIDREYDKTVTLFFVRRCGFVYTEPSHDPIFPADQEIRTGLYGYSQHSRIFGCQEMNEVCGPGDLCFDMDPLRSDRFDTTNTSGIISASEAAMLNLLYISMARSSLGTSLGNSRPNFPELLAERRRAGSISLALDHEQWHKEVRRLYDVSLARLQIATVNIAWGKYSHSASYRPGLLDAEFSNVKGVCPSVKIRATGWRNINLFEFVSFSVFLIMLWILTARYQEHILLVWLYYLIRPFVQRTFGTVTSSLGRHE